MLAGAISWGFKSPSPHQILKNSTVASVDLHLAGTDSGAPFQRIEELEQQNEVLRERLKHAEQDMERLQRENEQLRKELKAAGHSGNASARDSLSGMLDALKVS